MTTATLPTESALPATGACARDADELRAWLRLAHAKGLRPLALRTLLATFGGPLEVLAESFAALAQCTDEAAAKAVVAPPADIEGAAFDHYIERVREWASEPGNRVLTLADADYPQALLTMPDPPPLLYAKGRLDVLQSRAVAIVGSRHATPQGTEDARRFARAISEAGVAVVSGLALGIDAAAHRGALEGCGGTIAVIGTGADLVYPAHNHTLAHDIARDGAILSEWPLGTPARSANFPQRNRLIAGLSGGVLIVEAAMRSGSLITARLANEMGRDVFAIPAPFTRRCRRVVTASSNRARSSSKRRKTCSKNLAFRLRTPAHGRGAASLGRRARRGRPRASPKPRRVRMRKRCWPRSATRPRRLKFSPRAPISTARRCRARCSNWNSPAGSRRCPADGTRRSSARKRATCYIRGKIGRR